MSRTVKHGTGCAWTVQRHAGSTNWRHSHVCDLLLWLRGGQANTDEVAEPRAHVSYSTHPPLPSSLLQRASLMCGASCTCRLAQHFNAGMVAGVMTTVIMAPGERIKCLMQVRENCLNPTTLHVSLSPCRSSRHLVARQSTLAPWTVPGSCSGREGSGVCTGELQPLYSEVKLNMLTPFMASLS